tara:strand:- start:511 stop:720 length:210 start_codon:yes stop_codon:yes gene_type:complete
MTFLELQEKTQTLQHQAEELRNDAQSWLENLADDMFEEADRDTVEEAIQDIDNSTTFLESAATSFEGVE